MVLPLCRETVGVFYSVWEGVGDQIELLYIDANSFGHNRTLVTVVLPLCRETVGVFYSPSWLGKLSLNYLDSILQCFCNNILFSYPYAFAYRPWDSNPVLVFRSTIEGRESKDTWCIHFADSGEASPSSYPCTYTIVDRAISSFCQGDLFSLYSSVNLVEWSIRINPYFLPLCRIKDLTNCWKYVSKCDLIG